MAGNVREGTADWYQSDYYQTLAAAKLVVRNPQGSSDSLDPLKPYEETCPGSSYRCQ